MKKHKPHILSPENLVKMRGVAQRVKPWTRSTGPRTAEGKAACSLNNRRHGRRSRAFAVRRRITRLQRELAHSPANVGPINSEITLLLAELAALQLAGRDVPAAIA